MNWKLMTLLAFLLCLPSRMISASHWTPGCTWTATA